MGYPVLWLSGLAAAVLLVALGAVGGARLQKRWQRIAMVVLATLPGLIVGIMSTVFAGFLLAKGIRQHWFGYSLSWLFLFVAGGLLLGVQGIRRRGDEREPRARSWPVRGIAARLGAAVVVFAAAFLYMDTAVRIDLTKHHAQALEQMRAAMPPRVPDHRNAALVYEQAFEAMGDHESWRKKEWFGQIDNPAFDPTSPEIEAFLRAKAPAAALLRKAAAMPEYYFETDYTRGAFMRTPEPIKWGNASSLLARSARSRAARGDIKGALADVAVIRRMAAHLSAMPTSITQMVALAVDASATNTAERVLAAGPAKAEDIGELPVDVPACPFHASLIRTWQVHEASTVLMMAGRSEMPFEGPSGGVDLVPDNLTSAIWRVFFLPYEIAAYRRWLGRIRGMSHLPYSEMGAEAKKIQSDLAEGAGGILASVALPGIASIHMSTAETEARQRLAYLGLAATAYRAERGGYPRELSELVPRYIEAIPTDPFSGKRLKMLAVEGGLVLYSVYRDGEDDGGKDNWYPGGDWEADLSFCLGAAYEERRLKPAQEAAKRRKRVKAR